MPTKIKPKYGIDPVQKVPAFFFTDAQIGQLFNALPTVNGSRDELIVRLVECARTYLWCRNQNREKPTRAEQNAALKEVGQLALNLETGLRSLDLSLRGLDMDTEWELTIALPRFRKDDITDAIGDLADQLGSLAPAAEQALRVGNQRSGPRIQTHVQRTVERLAILYEEFTGNAFSHNPKLLTEYDGEPHSQAGRFIVAFFEIIDPNIQSTSLSTVMGHIVKSRHSHADSATG